MGDLWSGAARTRDTAPYDRQLLFLTMTLILVGLVMVFSASVTQAEHRYDNMFFFALRDGVAIAAAAVIGAFAMVFSGDLLRRISLPLLGVGLLLLLLVLLVGSEINSARRWIRLGGFNLQPAEFAKIIWILYLSGFLTRKREEVTRKLRAFVKQFALLIVMAALLLLQPDYGSLVVISGIFIGLLFVGGAHLMSFLICIALLLILLTVMAVWEPYRMLRITTFLDPWQDPFGKGYQLTQSLMAFGRGGLTGEGLGNSVQKMEYLPEAHTDFVFAILGEEGGFLGVAAVVLLEIWLIWRMFRISRTMLRAGEMFGGYVSFGMGMLLSIQTFINVGAASGMLPTKGLTFPLISYGGSSLAAVVAGIAIVLRLDHEFRSRYRRHGDEAAPGEAEVSESSGGADAPDHVVESGKTPSDGSVSAG